jgi:hypothetical protein
LDHIGGVMISMLASGAVDHGFIGGSGQAKNTNFIVFGGPDQGLNPC